MTLVEERGEQSIFSVKGETYATWGVREIYPNR